MRKRLVIAAIATVVIGVAAYWFSQPIKGSVEYHKHGYIAAANGPSIMERITRTWQRMMGKAYVFGGISGERLNRMRRHQSALIELGFLERRDLVLTNLPEMPPVKHLQWSVLREATPKIPADRLHFSQFTVTGTHVLTVVAVRQDMATLEALIRKFDVPEIK